jgi:hypothetical protein
MHDKNESSQYDGKHEDQKRPGLIERLKIIYKEKPTVFAFGLLGFSALALLLGTLLMGDINFPFTGTMP